MNITTDEITENFDDVTLRLVYESMLDPNTSNYSEDDDELTMDDVKRIIKNERISRILLDGEAVGVYTPGLVHISCYFEWGLKRNFHYSRIGIVYIDKKHRNKGIASKILKEHVETRDKYAECCNENNHASNAILSKYLKFHKRAYIRRRDEYMNIYIKE